MTLPRPIRLALPALLLAALLPAARASADPVGDFESMRLAQKRNIEQTIVNMPPLPGGEERTLDEIFRLRIEGVNLVARTSLPSSRVAGYYKVKVPEFGQPIMVRVVGGVGANKPELPEKPQRLGPERPDAPLPPHDPHPVRETVVPTELLLQATDYSTPRQITSLSLSQSGGVAFSVSRLQTFPTGSRSIQFLAQKIPAAPGGGAVTLTVSESDYRPGGRPFNASFTAPDCVTFLRRHPKEVDRYLRPLLAELGQESVFAPDPLLAQQVFPDRFRADPEARRRLEALLPDLAADDFHRRDLASTRLSEMGADAAKAMTYTDRSALTPEQNERIDRVLTPLGLIPRAESDRLRRDVEFLLNCLYSDDSTTRRSALAELKSLTGQTADLPGDADVAARTAAVRELRGKLAPTTRERNE